MNEGPWIQRERALKEALDVAHQIGDSFWAALKPLHLPAINVANPGAHVTDLIDALRRAKEEVSVELGVSAQRAERDRLRIERLRGMLTRIADAKDDRAWWADLDRLLNAIREEP